MCVCLFAPIDWCVCLFAAIDCDGHGALQTSAKDVFAEFDQYSTRCAIAPATEWSKLTHRAISDAPRPFMAAAREPLWDSRLPMGLQHLGVVMAGGRFLRVLSVRSQVRPARPSCVCKLGSDADAVIGSHRRRCRRVLRVHHRVPRADPGAHAQHATSPVSSLASLRAQSNIRMRRRIAHGPNSVFGPTQCAGS